eukprot:gene6252-10260_t
MFKLNRLTFFLLAVLIIGFLLFYFHLLLRVNAKPKFSNRDSTSKNSSSHAFSINKSNIHLMSQEEVSTYFGEYKVEKHSFKHDSAIVYLAPNSDSRFPVEVWKTTKPFKVIYRIELLAASIRSFKVAFGITFNYPVVIFHQGYKQKEKDYLLSSYNNIIFQEMSFKIPKECNKNKIQEWRKKKPHIRTFGYMSMCRYWATLIFSHPVLNSFKKVMRMDDDSYFHGQLDVDVFTLLDKHAYMYSLTNYDADFPKRNYEYLFPFLYKSKVFNSKNRYEIFDKFEKHNWAIFGYFNRRYPNTNFLVSRLDFWRTVEISEFSRKYGCSFFEFGWTDSTIHAIFLSLFFEPEEVLVKSLPYSHNFHDTTGLFREAHTPWMKHLTNLVKSSRFSP